MTRGINLAAGPFDGLAPYLRQIRGFPMLEPEEEYLLAKRWREHGDSGAAQRLVSSHLRLVVTESTGSRRAPR